MNIRICKTTEWSTRDWESFLFGFKFVFDKTNFSKQHFINKYCNTVDKTSYHALLLNDDGEIVGNYSVIPQIYCFNNEQVKLGLGADLFIMGEYRKDIMMLQRMYKKLTSLLVENGVLAVIGVPNDNSYAYWIKVGRWKDIGDIPYYIFPVKLGNIIGKFKFLNFFSVVYSRLSLSIASIISLFPISQKRPKYRIQESDCFISSRFYGDYTCDSNENFENRLSICDEDGVRTAYLIHSRNHGVLTFRSIYKGVRYALRENVDTVLFIGTLNVFQTLFLKVPKKLEPKRLPLTCDILRKEDKEKYSSMLDMKNWDFGLINYDVR